MMVLRHLFDNNLFVDNRVTIKKKQYYYYMIDDDILLKHMNIINKKQPRVGLASL